MEAENAEIKAAWVHSILPLDLGIIQSDEDSLRNRLENFKQGVQKMESLGDEYNSAIVELPDRELETMYKTILGRTFNTIVLLDSMVIRHGRHNKKYQGRLGDTRVAIAREIRHELRRWVYQGSVVICMGTMLRDGLLAERNRETAKLNAFFS
jgi:hypothetical protein